VKPFDVAICGLLLANSDIASAIGDRIYKDAAPGDAVTPYIIYSINAGRTEEVTFGLDGATAVYNVQAVASIDENGRGIAEDIAGYIREALHRAETTITGWGLYKLRQQSFFSITEHIERGQYAYVGGLYRMALDQVRN
jgi:hypothetical protein